MSKWNGGKKKSHIKHKKFADHNISSIEEHKLKAGNLTPPLATVPGLSFSSWRDDALPDVLWAIVLRGNLTQDECLKCFRDIIAHAREKIPNCEDTYLTHTILATFSDDQFDLWVQPLLKGEKTKSILSCLLFFESLPDRKHWQRHFGELPNEMQLDYVTKAVAECINHQSQASTDVRWLKIVYFIVVSQKIFLPESFDIDGFRFYPNHGDQRMVRPMVRSMEMVTRNIYSQESPIFFKENMRLNWQENFWQECYEKTKCNPIERKAPSYQDNSKIVVNFFEVYKKIAVHFIGTLKNTSIDSRHDASFGLVLYALVLGMEVARSRLDTTAGGRILLRSIVELFITFKFLYSKDDKILWDQHRNYGTGQSKLAFLKNVREENIPQFINLDDLHMYANEDMWQEFSEVNLKSWGNLNLRQMAEQANVKDIYDKYYDWSSGFIHGHWGVIRDTTYTTCLNPLHRLHRIPDLPKIEMSTVLVDIVAIVNEMIEILDICYPTLKVRLDKIQQD